MISPIMAGIALGIKLDSPGKIFFCQKRITQYGNMFQIYKFRTMRENRKISGSLITAKGDHRITTLGKWLRKYKLDELPQLLNVLKGEMTFVGARPEIPEFVCQYNKTMQATLLLPAGITSIASIHFRKEAELLEEQKETEKIYIQEILPEKMKWNLYYLKKFSIGLDIKIMLQTLKAVRKG